MAKYIHNLSGGIDYYLGVETADNAFYLIPTARESDYAANDALLTKLVSGDAKMSADGATDIAGGGADQIKFLTGEQLVRVKAFSDDEGVAFNGCGMSGEAIAGTTTDIDKLISSTNRFNGINIILTGQVQSDNLEVQVVDKDNVLGYGAGAVLNTFATSWFVKWDQSDQGTISVPYYGLIYSGLYVRIKYHSSGITNVKMYANLFLHKES